MKKLLFIFSLLHTALFATGCVDEIVIASTQDSAVQLDGRASETAWESAVSYPLRLLPQPNQEREIAFQEGSVRFLCGSQFLYVYAELTDDDIVQYGSETEDLCKRGDVLELFIRDRKKGCYWELHLSPAGKSSVLFYPNAGRRLFPEAFQRENPIRMAVRLDGTLNHYQDQDHGYYIEAKIPLSLFGKDFGKNNEWTLLATRYNYSKSFKVSQLSTSAYLPMADFHLVDYHTPIRNRK